MHNEIRTIDEHKLVALIIDDERPSREILAAHIENYCPELVLCDQTSNLTAGVASIRKHQPDIVFLDIEMPGHSGLEILKLLAPEEYRFSIIFITAFNEYAVQAFKLSAVDYLLKPIDPQELILAVKKAGQKHFEKELALRYEVLQENIMGDKHKKLICADQHGVHFLNIAEILFVEADSAYSHIHLIGGKKILLSKRLGDIEYQVSQGSEFFRIHRSYLVNLNAIASWVRGEKGLIKLNNGIQLPLSRERREEFLLWLGRNNMKII